MEAQAFLYRLYLSLIHISGQYAYDDNEHDTNELTLRGGGEEINDQLERQLNERLAMAGMVIIALAC